MRYVLLQDYLYIRRTANKRTFYSFQSLLACGSWMTIVYVCPSPIENLNSGSDWSSSLQLQRAYLVKDHIQGFFSYVVFKLVALLHKTIKQKGNG